MERIFDNNERLKRAEELYLRRNMTGSGNSKEKVNKKRKNSISFHILLMLNIVMIVFAIKNSEFVFSSNFLNKVNEYKNYSVLKIKEFFIGSSEEVADKKDEVIVEDTVEEKEVIVEHSVNSSILSQMDEDIKNLKAIYKFICPIKGGSISSEFGSRESSYQNVSGYHTGIDIAVKTGTDILAGLEGIVTLVSNEGDYGKHIKVRCNNVTTLYAHCSKIFVKEGQIVGLGQKIAEVGNTGNSTGPHLHFEIRIDDRFVDPGKVITF